MKKDYNILEKMASLIDTADREQVDRLLSLINMCQSYEGYTKFCKPVYIAYFWNKRPTIHL